MLFIFCFIFPFGPILDLYFCFFCCIFFSLISAFWEEFPLLNLGTIVFPNFINNYESVTCNMNTNEQNRMAKWLSRWRWVFADGYEDFEPQQLGAHRRKNPEAAAKNCFKLRYVHLNFAPHRIFETSQRYNDIYIYMYIHIHKICM